MEYTFSKLLKEAKNILSEMQKHLPPKEPNQTTTIVDPALDEIEKIDMNLLQGMMEYESRLNQANIAPMNSVPTIEELEENSNTKSL